MASIVVKSKQYSFIPEDVKSVLVGAGIAGAGAIVTYIAENWASVDLGEWTPFVAAGVAVIVNLVRKYIGVSKYAK
jgi:hypothetical protein